MESTSSSYIFMPKRHPFSFTHFQCVDDDKTRELEKGRKRLILPSFVVYESVHAAKNMYICKNVSFTLLSYFFFLFSLSFAARSIFFLGRCVRYRTFKGEHIRPCHIIYWSALKSNKNFGY